MQEVKESKKFKYTAGREIIHMDRYFIYAKKYRVLKKGDIVEVNGNYEYYKKNKNWELVTDKKTKESK